MTTRHVALDHSRHSSPAHPLLVHSSDRLGWPGLSVRTFHEPPITTQRRTAETPALSLVVLNASSVHLEWRSRTGAWQQTQAQTGDIFLRPPGGAPSELRWSMRQPGPLQAMYIKVQPDVIARTAEAMDRDPARCTIRELFAFRDPLLVQIGRQLAAATAEPRLHDRLYVESGLQLLVAHLLRCYTEAPAAAPEQPAGLSARQVQRIAEFVQAHLDQPLTLTALAEQVGYSPYHFSRLFRHATGASPYQFVLEQRVARAETLIAGSAAPLMDVALACGFANQSHLTRVFRSKIGVTPHMYRLLRRDTA